MSLVKSGNVRHHYKQTTTSNHCVLFTAKNYSLHPSIHFQYCFILLRVMGKPLVMEALLFLFFIVA